MSISHILRVIHTDRGAILANYEGGPYIELLRFRQGSVSYMTGGESFDVINVSHIEHMTLEPFNAAIDEWVESGYILTSFYAYLDTYGY
jgi:hypothetical protein